MFCNLIQILQCSALQVYWVRPARTKSKSVACCPPAVSPDMETRKLSFNFLVLSRALHTVQHGPAVQWTDGGDFRVALYCEHSDGLGFRRGMPSLDNQGRQDRPFVHICSLFGLYSPVCSQ